MGKQYLVEESTLTKMANNIRSITGETDTMTTDQMNVALEEVAANGISAGVPSGGINIKYIIPASYVPVRDGDMGFGELTFTFTRENVNQMFNVDWLLHDETDFTMSGYWIQHIQWNMHPQGMYGTSSNLFITISGAGKAGYLTPNSRVTTIKKTDLTANVSVGISTTTNAGYERRGENYKGLIFITDSSYDGPPIVDETKLTQFFTNCNGQLTAGW